jgi:FkbM family methyltransferase
MNALIKRIIPHIIPRSVVKVLSKFYKEEFFRIPPYLNLSYSQEGEDLILRRIFEGKEKGFYVDVGAYHPIKFSNTYIFYYLGWSGINIDAARGTKDIFCELRPRDINLELAISDREETITFYEFNEPSLNSFSKRISLARDGKEHFRLKNKRLLKTSTLKAIFDRYLENAPEIDFLSVDVEGYDFKVLISNDWNTYRPKIVLVEDLYKSSLQAVYKEEIPIFMEGVGYALFAKTFNTLFFRRNDFHLDSI